MTVLAVLMPYPQSVLPTSAELVLSVVSVAAIVWAMLRQKRR